MNLLRPTERQQIELEARGILRHRHNFKDLMDVIPDCWTQNLLDRVVYGYSLQYPRPFEYTFSGLHQNTAIINTDMVIHYLRKRIAN